MKVLFMSGTGDGLGLALRMKEQGHDVQAYVKDTHARHNYDGLLRKIKDYNAFLDKETLVVFDSTGGGKTAERLRGQGYHVIGGSVFADQLEMDRGTALDLMGQVGVKLPEGETFLDWESARSFARSYGKCLVFKPSGRLAMQDAVGTYVSTDPEDMVEMLVYFESISRGIEPEFELQEFIEGGVAISTEGYFNGEGFLQPFNHTIEVKATFNDNLGPAMGCSGNIIWKADRKNHIIEQGLERCGPFLREFDYRGPIDLNTVVREDGVWALEFTPRFGYDATPNLMLLLKQDFASLLRSIAVGDHPTDMVLDGGFSGGVHVSVPPYPSEEFRHRGGIPVRGFEKEDRANLYFYDIMLDKDNRLVTSPAWGNVVTTMGWGPWIGESLEKAYRLADKAKIPEKQYRTDLVDKLEKEYHKFHRLVSQPAGEIRGG